MNNPSKMTNAPTCATIDGIDLHNFGMVINSFSNPFPQSKIVSASIPAMDGDIDYTRFYGARTITINGSIIGNSNSDLNDRIDAAASYFGLKKSGLPFAIVFNHQPTRFWTCKLQNFQYQHTGLWKSGHIASFTMILKCVYPYSESTSITAINKRINSNRSIVLSNSGTVSCPISLQLINSITPNLATDANLTATNATISTNSSIYLYGGSSKKITRTNAGTFYSTDVVVANNWETTSMHVWGAYIYSDAAMTGSVKVVFTGDTTVEYTASQAINTFGWKYAFVKVPTNPVANLVSVTFKITDDGSNTEFYIDGYFRYIITSTEYYDSTYLPPPFISYGFAADVVNPILTLQKSYNVFPNENGNVDNYICAGSSIAKSAIDPLGDADKCTLFVIDGTSEINSQTIPVSGGVIYRIRFEYFVELLESSAIVLFRQKIDDVTTDYTVGGVNLGTISTNWQQYTTEVTIKAGITSIYLQLTDSNSGVKKLYLRNIQIVEATNGAGQTQDAYRKPEYSKIETTTTLDTNDSLAIDCNNMIAEKYDYSAKTYENAIASTSIGEMVLNPGTNVLQYKDSRSSSTPETESHGTALVKVSYRERFL